MGSWPYTSRIRSQKEPKFRQGAGRVVVEVWRHPSHPQVMDRVIALLQEARKAPASHTDLQKMADRKDRKHFKATYVDALVKPRG